MNLTEAARAKCPYYRRYQDRTIQCESCVNRTRLVFIFRRSVDAEKHKRRFCDTYGWDDCPYATKLSSQWEEKNE